MHSLHWLKVQECITFKTAYMVYCKKGSAPDYLADLLPSATHNHLLRSLTSDSIPSAKCQTSLASIGSFSVVEPKIWNNLPPAVRSKESTDSFRSVQKLSSLVAHTPWIYLDFFFFFFFFFFYKI